MRSFETRTISEITLSLPATTKVFDEFNIDYFNCQNTMFPEACRRVGIDPVIIETRINELTDRNDQSEAERVSQASLAELVEFIRGKHHRYTKREVTDIKALADKIATEHGEENGLREVRQILDRILEDVLPHLMKEEIVLFPYIVELESKVSLKIPRRKPHFGSIQNPVIVMTAEHVHIKTLLGELRTAASGFKTPVNACPGLDALFLRLADLECDLFEHIHLEDDILFPRSILLDEEAEKITNA